MTKGKKTVGRASSQASSSSVSIAAKQKPSSNKKTTSSRRSKKMFGGWFTFRNLLLVVGAVGCCIFAALFPSYWLKSFTGPLPLPKVIDTYMTDDPGYRQRLWGSFRSNVYFGMRSRTTRSLISGLVWVRQHENPSRQQAPVHIRHTCEHGDGLERFGWVKHDGVSFGQQEITDGRVKLTTDFVVDSDLEGGHTWTARVHAGSASSGTVSLIFYFYNEGREAINFTVLPNSKELENVSGNVAKTGDFSVKFTSNTSSQPSYGYLATRLPKIVQFTDFLKHLFKKKSSTELPGEVYLDNMEQTPNLVAYQVTGSLPLDLEVTFSSNSSSVPVTGETFDSVLTQRANNFDERFESVFPLQSKGFDKEHIAFAKAAFSNLIGGISYFFGKSLVTNQHTSRPIRYFPTPLYTAVPSRSFFPRGFLWDEGFHQLLVSRFDMDITKDVLGHWLDLMNIYGWIPREQILGEEALSKVPNEFVPQHYTSGNPPTLFLAFDTLLDQMEKENKIDTEYLKRVYPRLLKWFDWFDESQDGPRPMTFRWRGRNSTTDRELNPKTLTSGLDDYPRASHPSDEEYHIDLRCWMALALKVLCRVSNYIEEDSSKLQHYYANLTDMTTLDELHWDNSRKMYSDYGNHTPHVVLAINRDIKPPVKVRKVKKSPKLGFVNSFGYVNLFPLLMKMIPADSDKLGVTLDHLGNKSLLWTQYGLRSVGKSDPFYAKYNTEHDQPYWRGAIWINMNYLTVKALYHYGNTDGPYQQQALELYKTLRSNLINNMFKEYQRTGYIWEQYNDKNGHGKGTHPFTGWSSLIVLIMAEQY